MSTRTRKVAVVTGSNKGIGYAIVKGLCEKLGLNGVVYLTARDTERGQAAVDELKKLYFYPIFHQLDITDQASVDNFKDYIKTNYGGIDILINNAAIAFKAEATEPFAVQAKETVRVNYFGTLRVCEALFPLLRQNARVVNISSVAGHLSLIKSVDLKAKLKSESLDIPTLNTLMEKFVKDSEAGKNVEEGWGSSAYVVSKVGLSALSFVQQRLFDAETPNRNVAVNSVHPGGMLHVIQCIANHNNLFRVGYVDTDMTSNKGPLTIEEGASAPLFLALEADFKGKYVWRDSTIVEWDGTLPAQY